MPIKYKIYVSVFLIIFFVSSLRTMEHVTDAAYSLLSLADASIIRSAVVSTSVNQQSLATQDNKEKKKVVRFKTELISEPTAKEQKQAKFRTLKSILAPRYNISLYFESRELRQDISSLYTKLIDENILKSSLHELVRLAKNQISMHDEHYERFIAIKDYAELLEKKVYTPPLSKYRLLIPPKRFAWLTINHVRKDKIEPLMKLVHDSLTPTPQLHSYQVPIEINTDNVRIKLTLAGSLTDKQATFLRQTSEEIEKKNNYYKETLKQNKHNNAQDIVETLGIVSKNVSLLLDDLQNTLGNISLYAKLNDAHGAYQPILIKCPLADSITISAPSPKEHREDLKIFENLCSTLITMQAQPYFKHYSIDRCLAQRSDEPDVFYEIWPKKEL